MPSSLRLLRSGFVLLLIASFGMFTTAGARVEGLQSSALDKRQAQATALCSGDYSWTQNRSNDSPCTLAAKVHIVCEGSAYSVDALLPDHHYDRPTKGTANECSCSWLAYNLLMACTACQGQSNSIQRWPYWTNDCGPERVSTTTFFPKSQPLPSDVAIPFWALNNPSTWEGSKFNENQAKALAAQDRPDFVSTDTVPDPLKKKTSVGVIAGAVVAACVGVIVAVLLLLVYLRKKRMANKRTQGGTVPMQRARSDSDLSEEKYPTPAPVNELSWRSNSSFPSLANSQGDVVSSHGQLPSLHYQWNSAVTTPPQSPPPAQTEFPIETRITPFPITPATSDRALSPDPSVNTRTTKGRVVVSPTLGSSSANRPAELEASTVPAFSEAAFNTTVDDHTLPPRLNPPAYTETPDPSESVSIRPNVVRPQRMRGFPSSYDSNGSYNDSASSLRVSAPSIAVVERAGNRTRDQEPEI